MRKRKKITEAGPWQELSTGGIAKLVSDMSHRGFDGAYRDPHTRGDLSIRDSFLLGGSLIHQVTKFSFARCQLVTLQSGSLCPWPYVLLRGATYPPRRAARKGLRLASLWLWFGRPPAPTHA